MPNYILQSILRNSGKKWSAEDLLGWIEYMNYTSKRERDYIIKIATLLK